MKHEMVDSGVGEAEKHLLGMGGGLFQLPVVKQIGKQAIGIIPTNSAEDHICLRILKGLKKIRSPLLRMGSEMINAGESVGCDIAVLKVIS